MKTAIALLTVTLLSSIATAGEEVPVYRWQVRQDRLADRAWSIKRQEVVILEPQYVDASGAVNLSDIYEVKLRWRPYQSTNAYSYVTNGVVSVATNGTVQALWLPGYAADGADIYDYEIALKSAAGSNLRAGGLLTMVGSLADQPATNLPSTLIPFDWSMWDHLNIEAAPFATEADLHEINNRIDLQAVAISNVTGLVGTGVAGVESNLQAHVAGQVIRDAGQDEQIALALNLTTNTFAGAGSTGTVTSAAGDEGKYLKADGSWGTPEASSVAWEDVSGKPAFGTMSTQSTGEYYTAAALDLLIAAELEDYYSTSAINALLASYVPTNDPAVLAALTNMTAGTGIIISGSGRNRQIGTTGLVSTTDAAYTNTAALASAALPRSGGILTGAITVPELNVQMPQDVTYSRYEVYPADINTIRMRWETISGVNGMDTYQLDAYAYPAAGLLDMQFGVRIWGLEALSLTIGGETRTNWPAEGISPEVATNIAEDVVFSPSRVPYVLTSAPTVTVTHAMTDTLALAPTNDVTITMDLSTYSSNFTHTLVLGLDLRGVSHTIVFATNTIYGAETAGFVATNSLYSFTLHKGWRQSRFEILKSGLTQ